MPNVGFGEVFVLLVVVMLVVGPAKLPEIARSVGKAYRMFQMEMQKAQETLRVSFDDTPAAPVARSGGVIDVPDATAAAAPAVAAAVAPLPEAPAAASPQVEAPPAPAHFVDVPEPELPPADLGIERNYEDT